MIGIEFHADPLPKALFESQRRREIGAKLVGNIIAMIQMKRNIWGFGLKSISLWISINNKMNMNQDKQN